MTATAPAKPWEASTARPLKLALPFLGRSGGETAARDAIDESIRLWRRELQLTFSQRASTHTAAVAPTPQSTFTSPAASVLRLRFDEMIGLLRTATHPAAIRSLQSSPFLHSSTRIGALIGILASIQPFLRSSPPPPLPPPPFDLQSIVALTFYVLKLCSVWTHFSLPYLHPTRAQSGSAPRIPLTSFIPAYTSLSSIIEPLLTDMMTAVPASVSSIAQPSAVTAGATAAATATSHAAVLSPLCLSLLAQSLSFIALGGGTTGPNTSQRMFTAIHKYLRSAVMFGPRYERSIHALPISEEMTDEMGTILSAIILWLSVSPQTSLKSIEDFTASVLGLWNESLPSTPLSSPSSAIVKPLLLSSVERCPPPSQHIAILKYFNLLTDLLAIRYAKLNETMNDPKLDATMRVQYTDRLKAFHNAAFRIFATSLENARRSIESRITAAVTLNTDSTVLSFILPPIFALIGVLHSLYPFQTAQFHATEHVNGRPVSLLPQNVWSPIISDYHLTICTLIDRLITLPIVRSSASPLYDPSAPKPLIVTNIAFEKELHLYDTFHTVLSIALVHASPYIVCSPNSSLLRTTLTPAFNLLLDTMLHAVDSTWVLVGMYEGLPIQRASSISATIERIKHDDIKRWIRSDTFTLLPLISRSVGMLYPFLRLNGETALQSEALYRIHSRCRYIHGCWRWYNLHHTAAESPTIVPDGSVAAAMKVALKMKHLSSLNNGLFLSIVMLLATIIHYIPGAPLQSDNDTIDDSKDDGTSVLNADTDDAETVQRSGTHFSLLIDTLAYLEFCRVDFTAYKDIFIKLITFGKTGVLPLQLPPPQQQTPQSQSTPPTDTKRNNSKDTKQQQSSKSNPANPSAASSSSASASASASPPADRALSRHEQRIRLRRKEQREQRLQVRRQQLARSFATTFVSQFMFPSSPTTTTATSVLAERCFPARLRARYAQRPFICSFLPPTVTLQPLPPPPPPQSSASSASSAPSVNADHNSTADRMSGGVNALERKPWRDDGVDIVEVSRHYLCLSILKEWWTLLSNRVLCSVVIPFTFRYFDAPIRHNNKLAHSIFTAVSTHILIAEYTLPASVKSGSVTPITATTSQATAPETDSQKAVRRLSWLALPRGWLTALLKPSLFPYGYSPPPIMPPANDTSKQPVTSTASSTSSSKKESDDEFMWRSILSIKSVLPYYLRTALKHYPKEVSFESISEAYIMIASTFPSNDLFVLYSIRLLIDRIIAAIKRIVPPVTLRATSSTTNNRALPISQLSPPTKLATDSKSLPSKSSLPSQSSTDRKARLEAIRAVVTEAAAEDPTIRLIEDTSFTPVSLGEARSLFILSLQLIQIVDYSLLSVMLQMLSEVFDVSTHLPLQQQLCTLIGGVLNTNFDLYRRDDTLRWYFQLIERHRIVLAPPPPSNVPVNNRSRPNAVAIRIQPMQPATDSPASNVANAAADAASLPQSQSQSQSQSQPIPPQPVPSSAAAAAIHRNN